MPCHSIAPNTGKVLKCFEHLSAAQLEKHIARGKRVASSGDFRAPA